jgi:hypothetical protein
MAADLPLEFVSPVRESVDSGLDAVGEDAAGSLEVEDAAPSARFADEPFLRNPRFEFDRPSVLGLTLPSTGVTTVLTMSAGRDIRN